MLMPGIADGETSSNFGLVRHILGRFAVNGVHAIHRARGSRLITTWTVFTKTSDGYGNESDQ